MWRRKERRNARRPAAVAGGNVETSQRIVDVVFGALAPALPERIPAASQGTMNNVMMGGHRRSGRAVCLLRDDRRRLGGGSGRGRVSGIHCHMSNTRNTPVGGVGSTIIRCECARISCGAARAASAGTWG